MRPPAFWTHDEERGSGSLARALLSPLGALYAWTVQRRIDRAAPAEAGLPVICVGNITLGGTGKTPIAIALLEKLDAMGVAAHGLSRGYGGRLKGPVRVDPEQHDAADVGDEPLLLARTAPVWISRQRPAGAAMAREAGAQAIVMDDGHQNPSLMKDLSIVVIDGEAGWGANRVFPAGPLREPVTRGLARADAVIVMTPGPDAPPKHARLGLDDLEIPVFHAWLEAPDAAPEGRLAAFAGIGRPQKFYDSLQAAGGDIATTASFPDHHPYTKADFDRLVKLANDYKARLITTEKDRVRLPAEVRERVMAWPVKARFSNEGAVDGLLRDMMDNYARSPVNG